MGKQICLDTVLCDPRGSWLPVTTADMHWWIRIVFTLFPSKILYCYFQKKGVLKF